MGEPKPSNAWQPGHTRIKHSRIGRWRALVLLMVHAAIAAHILLWLRYGRTVSPVEPSESMQTLREGVVNAGFVFFAAALLSTALLGRWFCGWGCHIVALQDACGWLMMRLGVKPKPFRARLLMWFPLGLALYMFVWPVFHREVIRPLLMDARGRLPWWLGQSDPIPGVTTEFIVHDFWATFAPWYVAIPFILVCTFGVVYFLGAKGFCTYGCPYGGFFAPLDRLAPGKIRVTDDCEQCGHCTAVCTSNVRVHEEVRDFGMVVDPGCMKCMDCVSVCPKEALYFGLGSPLLFSREKSAKAREKHQKREQAAAGRAKRWDLSWGEEVALAALFLILFLCYRGMGNQVAMLMAVGMALIAAFCSWKLWSMRPVRLGGAPNIRLQALQLRFRGRWKPAGMAVAVATALLLAAAAWSGVVRGMLWNAERLYATLDTPLAVALRPEFQATAAEAESARRSLALYRRADGFSRGGIGWPLTPDQRLNVAYMQVIRGDLDAAGGAMREVISTGKPQDSLISQVSEVLRARAIRRNNFEQLSPEQARALEAEIIGLHEMALARRSQLDASRLMLSFRKLQQGATAGGEGRPPTFTPASVAAARAMWEGPQAPGAEQYPRLSTWLSMARLERAIGGEGSEERIKALLDKAGAAMGSRSADDRLQVAGFYAQVGRKDRAAELARDAVGVARSAGMPEVSAADLFGQLARPADAEPLARAGLARARALGPHTGRTGTFVAAANVLARLGKADEAMSLYDESAAIIRTSPARPGRTWDLVGVARAMMAFGSGSSNPAFVLRGITLLEQARDLAPEVVTIRFELAQRYAELERLDDAERELTAAATLADRNAPLARQLSSLLAARGKAQESLQWETIAQRRLAPAQGR